MAQTEIGGIMKLIMDRIILGFWIACGVSLFQVTMQEGWALIKKISLIFKVIPAV